MLKARVIPCLDVKDGRVVKGVNFVDLQRCGRSRGTGASAIRYEREADELRLPGHHRQPRTPARPWYDVVAPHRGTMLYAV